jgi:hypothetical protein
MEHRGGLAWAGHHLYSELWHLEHPDEADAGASLGTSDAAATSNAISSDAGVLVAQATTDADAATATTEAATTTPDAGTPHRGHGSHH